MTSQTGNEAEAATPRTRRILSIDGGGVRGLVAAVMLDALEAERRAIGATRSLAECFDIIAGTSTGAIIAAALAAPSGFSPGDLRKLYRERAREIFPRRFWGRLPVFGRLRQFFGPLYRLHPLERVLGDALGDLEFSDVARNLIVCAYSIDPREAAFFRGGPDFNKHAVCAEFLCTRVADAVAGSAAAPTFFPPKLVQNRKTGATKTLIDGGVFVNDPAQVALAEAIRLFPDDEFDLISFGSGRLIAPYPFDVARGWGFFEWLSPVGPNRTPLLSVIADGQARAVNAQLKKLLGDSYHRFDYDLAAGYGSDALDDASRGNLRRLEAGAERMAATMQPKLRAVAELLG